MTSSDLLTLPDVLHLIRREHGYALTYSLLWRAVAEGRVPARRRGTRWMMDPASVPAALEVLGYEPRPKADPTTAAAAALA